MQRITISLPDDIAERLDEMIAERGYTNRSEIFRDMIRREASLKAAEEGDAQAVAVVSYIYNHHERRLSSRMTEHQHSHADLVVSLMHAHVSEEDCLETVFLRGSVGEVLHFANSVLAEPGVRNGQINCIPL